jgi:hypothetical protein
VDYLPSGERAEVSATEYANDRRLEGNIYPYWFHPAKAVGPAVEIKVSFEDVEGRGYKICATIPAAQNNQPRKIHIGPIEEA